MVTFEPVRRIEDPLSERIREYFMEVIIIEYLNNHLEFVL